MTDFIPSEVAGIREVDGLSRDTVTVTVPASTTYDAGTVLGQIQATERYVPFDDTATDGSENAAAILCRDLENATGAPVNVRAMVITGYAEVLDSDLRWGNGVDQVGGRRDLRAAGIRVRR